MDLQIRNKVALVFGGSKGIGLGIARILVQEGAQVILAARNDDRLMRAKKEIGAVEGIVTDLSQENAARDCIASVIRKYKSLHILVINSGGPKRENFEGLNPQDWMTAFQELWLSGTEAIKQALQPMRQQKWGRIIWITSLAAKEPLPSLTLSNGLRAGITGLIKSISNEVAQDGITINSIMPGLIDTERLAELGYTKSQLIKDIPAGRLGDPVDIGNLAAFLASDQAGYITGQAITFDGGRRKSH